MFNNSIKITDFSDRTEVTLPYYFADSEEPLTLILRLCDGQVYASDNGRAYNELKKKAEDIAEKMADYFACVCCELKLNGKKEIVIPIDRSRDIFKLIQTVALVANAYMYPEVNEYYMEFHLPYREDAVEPSGTSVPKGYVEKLLSEIRVEGDHIKLPFFFAGEPCPMGILFSKSDMTLTDLGDFDGGSIINRIDFQSGGEFCEEKIASMCRNFGCVYDNLKIYYKLENEKNISRAVLDFLQMASVLGETWRYIVLE